MVDDEKETSISSRPSPRPSAAHEPRGKSGNFNERPRPWTFQLAAAAW
jgi:hypothetical protein